jgi:hypothetical protein
MISRKLFDVQRLSPCRRLATTRSRAAARSAIRSLRPLKMKPWNG